MPEPVISVRGEASLEVEPEIAVVWVTVQARDADRHRAVELLAKRSGAVSGTIKGFGEAIEKLESQPVSVQPVFKDGKVRERISGYLAQAGFIVTVRDFAVLGELVAGLADAELVSVTGPDWRLRPDSPVYRAARLAAAKDATRRAGEYAEAFGGRITGLVEAADTGLLAPQPQPRRTPMAFAAARAAPSAAGHEGPAFDFEPAKQTVSAQVDARYTMTEPQFAEESAGPGLARPRPRAEGLWPPGTPAGPAPGQAALARISTQPVEATDRP